MARGRDATDAAITTSFGPNLLAGFKVIGEELPAASGQRTAHPNAVAAATNR
jgi:hypothetical protein